MKLKSPILISIFLSLTVFIVSCKDEDMMPDNGCIVKGNCDVMTCKVNGKSWKADCEDDPLFGCDPVYCVFNKKTNFLAIKGLSLIEPTTTVYFNSPYKKGYYLGLQSLSNQFVVACPYCNSLNVNQDPYYLDSLYLAGKHLEIIQIDSLHNLIEGRFNFRAIEHHSHDTIYITEGYFKLSFL